MAKPIKILHLIPTLSSGGAERQLVNLVTTTSKELIDHAICVIGDPEFFSPQIRAAGFRVIELGIFAKRPFFKTASEFRRVTKEQKPDIIQTWLYDANISARLAMFPGSGKIPIITSLQLPDYEPEVARIGNWNPHKVRALKAIDKLTSRITKPYYVACSEFVKNSYRRHFGLDESRTEVIYNSVDPELLKASPEDVIKLRGELNLRSDAFIFLNVGRLDPQKNHTVLFEAFKKVSREIPSAFLLLAGVGDAWEGKLKELAAFFRIDKKVLFLGRRSDVGTLLEVADVFVFPSNFEGLGVALIEAMFASLPCIASGIDVFRECIADGETGLLMDQTSPEDLAGAMLRLYRDPELRRSLGDNAFRKADAEFNADKTARQWEGFYQKVLRREEK